MKKIKVCLLYGPGDHSFRVRMSRIRDFLAESVDYCEFVDAPSSCEGMVPSSQARDPHEDIFSCDLVLAILDQPSIAVGLAVGVALRSYRRPVLAVAIVGAVIEERVRQETLSHPTKLLYCAIASYDDLHLTLPTAIKHFGLLRGLQGTPTADGGELTAAGSPIQAGYEISRPSS